MAEEFHQEDQNGAAAVAETVTVAEAVPVGERERVGSLDALRGLAVLGILAINIHQMGLPQAAFSNPSIMGDFGLPEMIAWGGVVGLFLQKFMAIFAMLFGAGLVLQYTRLGASSERFSQVYFRRMGVLLVIGLVHAYLIWWGDILVTYAVCGALVYLFRKWSPKRLLVVGAIILLLPVPLAGLVAGGIGYVHRQAEAAQAKVDAGAEVTPDEQGWLNMWVQIAPNFAPTAEQITNEIEVHTVKGYGSLFAHRALLAIMYQTVIFLAFSMWKTVGLMMFGMALMKWAVFSAERSRAFYLRMVLFGLGIGLPLDAFGIALVLDSQFSPQAVMLSMGVTNYIASVFSAAGYVGLIMLVWQGQVLTQLRTRLAAVGRMALTNYLMHSVVFTTLFYGYGFGLFGEFGTIGLMALAAGMWAVQLYLSPVWLRHYRFGPVEWLWRSLTYGKGQPMKRVVEAV